MISPNGVRMYAAFERNTLITETAAFTPKVTAAVFVVHGTSCKFHGQAVKTTCNRAGCSLPLSARNCNTRPLADRLNRRKRARQFSFWAAEVTAVTALPLGRALGEPTVLCSRMDESIIVGYYTSDESIIVGYYTSAEVDSPYSQPSQIAHERSLTHGKKRWN